MGSRRTFFRKKNHNPPISGPQTSVATAEESTEMTPWVCILNQEPPIELASPSNAITSAVMPTMTQKSPFNNFHPRRTQLRMFSV